MVDFYQILVFPLVFSITLGHFDKHQMFCLVFVFQEIIWKFVETFIWDAIAVQILSSSVSRTLNCMNWRILFNEQYFNIHNE